MQKGLGKKFGLVWAARFCAELIPGLGGRCFFTNQVARGGNLNGVSS
jgi:hypothetical protein